MSFKKQWNVLESSEIDDGLNTIRVAQDCILEVFLAIDKFKSHIFILHLPDNYYPKINNRTNDNIELQHTPANKLIQIKLLDNDFTGLFDDLILSLIHSIKYMRDIRVAAELVIETYTKWNVFFARSPEHQLSNESVMGMWGELMYLYDLLIESKNSDNKDALVKSWVGPYGSAHDFELVEKSVEVKTKLKSTNKIKVSSEYQLEQTDDKELELTVLSVVESLDGKSIKDLFVLLKNTIQEQNGDVTHLLYAFKKQNLDEQRLEKYADLRFLCKEKQVFDCLLPNFPKIERKNLDEAITFVKYGLDTRLLSTYSISKKVY